MDDNLPTWRKFGNLASDKCDAARVWCTKSSVYKLLMNMGRSRAEQSQTRGQLRASVETTIVRAAQICVDCNRHSSATNPVTCAKIFGLILVELPIKTREMHEELVDKTTACARRVHSTSSVQSIRAIHSREPRQFMYCSSCYWHTKGSYWSDNFSFSFL